MAIWTCKIVDISQNWDGDDMPTTDGNGSCHRLVPSFFEEMTCCRRQKHCWRWPGNHNGRLKFCKYLEYLPILRLFTSTRSRVVLSSWRQWQLPWIRAVVFRTDDTLPTSKTSPAITRINQNSSFTKLYACEIEQNLSKNIFLLLGFRHYDSVTHCFPTVTCNGFCSHLRKIILQWPWPHWKTEISISKSFFVDSMYTKTIDITRI